MSRRDGCRQAYGNFSNRPYPLAQNRGTIRMGIVLWRVIENPTIMIAWVWPKPNFQNKNAHILTAGPTAEIPDGADGCAVKS